MWKRMITDEIDEISTFFFFFRKRKGKREEKKKEGSKLLILIYTRLDMILDRRRRVKIRDANEQTCCWTKYREYIYIMIPCEHILKSIRRRSANFRKLDDTWIRIVSPLRLDNLFCFYANDVFSLLTAFVRCVISVFTWAIRLSNLSTLSSISTRCVYGSYLTSKGRLMVDTCNANVSNLINLFFQLAYLFYNILIYNILEQSVLN